MSKMERKLKLDVIEKNMTLAGLNQAAVAKFLDVSRETVSKWFKGESFPRPAKALKLARLLSLAYDDFIESNITNEPVVAFRKKGTRKTQLLHLENARSLGLILEKLSRYLPFDIESRPPSLIDPKNEYSYVERAADAVRQHYGFSETPSIDDLIDCFGQFNAVIIPARLGEVSDHENALHIYLPGSMTTWIYLNIDSKIHDFKFWMAHELGHVKSPELLGEEGEDFADRFAGAILIRESEIEKMYQSLSEIKNQGQLINKIKAFAKTLELSPITIVKRLDDYSSHYKLPAIQLGRNSIFPATTNFSKTQKTVSASMFKSALPAPSEYISTIVEQFKTPIFECIRSYFKDYGVNASLVEKVLRLGLLDSKELTAELCGATSEDTP